MSPVYFTDRDLGRQFPAILRAAGIAVEEHAVHFVPDTADDLWLATIASRGWIAVTHDKRIRYKSNERDAVMRSRVGLFIVIGAAPYSELADNFVRTIARIDTFVAVHPPPWIAKITRPAPAKSTQSSVTPGRVELWLTHEQWSRANR